MQTPIQLHNNLTARGFTFTHEADKLWVEPRAKLTTADVAAITEHKAALLALLEPSAKRPYLAEAGEICIPFTTHPRFHWWGGAANRCMPRWLSWARR